MPQSPLPRPAILVLEDEVLIRMEAVDMFEEAGFKTYQAKSADAAMDVLGNTSDIGIVFTDVDMPGSMNGLGLAARVSENWPEIRIMVASGILGVKQGDLPQGALFFPKPYPTDQIVAAAKQLDC